MSREVSVNPAMQIENAKKAISQKNYTLAAELLEPLAEEGRGDAQYALGYLYFNGMGVKRNNSIAARWFKAAADNGNKNAKLALSHIPPAKSAVIDLREKNKDLSDSDGSQLNEISMPAKEIVPEDSIEDIKIAETEHMTAEKANDVNIIASGNKLTDGEKWIAGQPGNNFTIQLIVLSDESALQLFINDNNLQGNAIYYQTQKNGKSLYVLIHGSFESYDMAKETADALPSKLKVAEPWIRKLSKIQKLLPSH
jgi:septal ring-binding cell division protein DamX